jgi:hypothetical protein
MSKIEGLLAAIDHARDGDPWHGPSLAKLLSDVDASSASARPIAGVRSIWEIVLHLTAWTREVARRLDGHPPAPPAGGEWPDPGETTAPAWDAARAPGRWRLARSGRDYGFGLGLRPRRPRHGPRRAEASAGRLPPSPVHRGGRGEARRADGGRRHLRGDGRGPPPARRLPRRPDRRAQVGVAGESGLTAGAGWVASPAPEVRGETRMSRPVNAAVARRPREASRETRGAAPRVRSAEPADRAPEPDL